MDAAVLDPAEIESVEPHFSEASDALQQIRVQRNRGRKLIDLNGTFQRAGRKENGLPELAIARADRDTCYVQVQQESARFRTYGRRERVSGQYGTSLEREGENMVQVLLPRWGGTLPGDPDSWAKDQYSTATPTLPDDIARKYDFLENYHVLYEVESWSQVPRPVVDPFLLRHVAGSVWAVLEQWDVSALEAAALSEVGAPYSPADS